MQDKITNSSDELLNCPSLNGTIIGGPQTKDRDERIDSLKFGLIVLVVAVHVIMRGEFVDSTACIVLWNGINIFAMPLFVFISGYFSRKNDIERFWPNIWKLLEPLIIFQIIGLIFYDNKPLSIWTILTPWYVLWYLLSLIYWRFILQIIPDKILRHKKLIIICTFCISILAGFLPFDRVLSIQRTLSFMPFFFLGYCMRGKNIYLPNKYKPICIVLLALIFVILCFFPYRLNSLFNDIPYKSINEAAIRVICFALSFPMSIAFINICCNTPWIARQGRFSLHYYIYHALLIQPFMIVAGKLNIPMTFLSAVFIIIGITLFISFALNIPLVRKMTNPSSFLKKRINNL